MDMLPEEVKKSFVVCRLRLRDVAVGESRRRRLTLTLSPLLHGGQREHNVSCLTLEFKRYGWPALLIA